MSTAALKRELALLRSSLAALTPAPHLLVCPHAAVSPEIRLRR